jgi:hypothetical protein
MFNWLFIDFNSNSNNRLCICLSTTSSVRFLHLNTIIILYVKLSRKRNDQQGTTINNKTTTTKLNNIVNHVNM